MKNHVRIAVVVLSLSFSLCPLWGKEKLPQATYSNLQVHYNKKTGDLELTFDGKISAPGMNYSITITPHLTKDGKESPYASVPLAALPAQVMEGDWYRLSRERKEKTGTRAPKLPQAIRILPTASYSYSAPISQREWVDGVSVTVYTTMRTYSGITGETVFRFTDLLSFLPEEEEYIDTANVHKVPAIARPFVEPVTEKNRDIVDGRADLQSVEGYVEERGEGALTVYFEVGSSIINPGFTWNSRTLAELIDVVEEMKRNDNDPRVVVVGYSSPEGSPDLNKRLSMERAWSIQKYLTAHTALNASEIATYEGGINWIGLKRLIIGDHLLPNREEILATLELPVWNARTQTGRHGALMRLNNGETYRYLLNHYFPQLRGAAFIKVFYYKPNKQARQITY
jgi:hypothetical protein